MKPYGRFVADQSLQIVVLQVFSSLSYQLTWTIHFSLMCNKKHLLFARLLYANKVRGICEYIKRLVCRTRHVNDGGPSEKTEPPPPQKKPKKNKKPIQTNKINR